MPPHPDFYLIFGERLTRAESLALEAASANRALRAFLEQINPARLRPSDLPMIERLREAGLRVRGVAAQAAGWEAYIQRLRDAAEWGLSTRPRVLAAAMLAGRAVMVQRNPAHRLRADLAPNLHALAALGLPTTHAFPLTLNVAGAPVTLTNKTKTYLNAYSRLNLQTGGRLADALERSVTDPSIRLRLGRDLATLDPVAIERHLTRVLANDGPVRSRQTHPGNGQTKEHTPELHAPTEMELRFDWYKCVVEQETTGDQAFWVCSFVSLGDVARAVQEIEQAIANDPAGTAESTFAFEWTTTTWQSTTQDARRDVTVNVDSVIGRSAIKHGFGPWTAVITGIENDNDEYVAIQEVAAQVGAYADTVSDVAGTVAQIATAVGATQVAAAASAVKLAADVVELSADVVEAVVEVVNYFDSNDLLGRATFSSPNDYAGIPLGSVDVKPVVIADNPDNGGRYEVRVTYVYNSVSDDFHRMFRIQEYEVVQEGKHPWKLFGQSGEDDLCFIFPEPVNVIRYAVPSFAVSGHDRHAEFVTVPTLDGTGWTVPILGMKIAPNQSARAKVHYGASAGHGIDYSVTVTGTKILVSR